jgi:predicted histone-like DNA-binding protein
MEVLEYRIIPISVPQADGTRVIKFYAIAVPGGRKTLDDLALEISGSTTVTHTDVIAVLDSLVQIIPKYIQDGKTVEMGAVGNFRLTIRNNGGSSSLETWTPALIKGAHLTYDATKLMRNIAKNVHFQRWINREAEDVLNAANRAADRVEKAQKHLADDQATLIRLTAFAQSHPDQATATAGLALIQAQIVADQADVAAAQDDAAVKAARAQRIMQDLNLSADADTNTPDEPTTK